MFRSDQVLDPDSVVPYTEDMERLERVISTPAHAQQFIVQSLTLNGVIATQIRFCSTVDSLEKQHMMLSTMQKRNKLNTIIDLFLKDESFFNISRTFDKGILEEVLRKRDMVMLNIAKRHCLHSMTENEEVLKLLGTFEKQQSQ